MNTPRSLRRVLVLLVTLAVLPGVVVVTLASLAEQREQIVTVRADLAATARLVASNQEQLIAGVRSVLAAMAAGPSVQRPDTLQALCVEFTGSLRNKFPHFANFGILDLAGLLTCRPDPTATPVVAKDRLYFKRADQDAEVELAKAENNAGEPAVRNASILVIDDDPDVRGFITASLDDYGYRVRDAADGTEGLAKFAEERPDLVVLDYAMPGLSGGEVAARILKSVPGQPILFVSGYSESEAIIRAAPHAQTLAKPFRPDALDAAVREALGQGK